MIYLSDHEVRAGNRGTTMWARALGRVFGGQFKGQQFFHRPPDSHPAYEQKSAIFFVHCNPNADAYWLAKARRVKCNFVFVSSIGKRQIRKGPPRNVHSCYWNPNHFRAGKMPEIAGFIRSFRDEGAPAWRLLQPDFEAAQLNRFADYPLSNLGDSPTVASAVRQLCQDTSGAPGGARPRRLIVVDYRTPEAFQTLWSKGLDTLKFKVEGEEIDLNEDLLIISGEVPPAQSCDPGLDELGGIDFCSHLTACSWALAWRLRFRMAGGRIAIVAYEPSGAGSLESILRHRPYGTSPTYPGIVPGVVLMRNPSAAEVVASIPALRFSQDPDVLDHGRLEMLRGVLWASLTSNDEAHHAVSNVLGALLLRPSYPLGAAPQDNLLRLVRLCSVGPAGKGLSWGKLRQVDQLPHAVLLDDMAGMWSPFIASALGRSPIVPLAPMAEKLAGVPERLGAVVKQGRRFISICDLVGGGASVRAEYFFLLLDLRFFQPDGDGRAYEEPFYRGVAELGTHLLNSQRNLPWAPKNSAERKRLGKDLGILKKAIKNGRLPRGKIESIFPRLIALIDPTLPIVIFSSTHRAELVQSFAEYGNIITDFRKPMLSAMTHGWEDACEGLKADFQSALDVATKTLRARNAFIEFSHKGVEARPAMPLAGFANEGGAGSRWRVELFFDESETANQGAICLGGVLLAFKSNQSSKQAIYDRLAAADSLWGWSSEGPGIRPLVFSPKGRELPFYGGGRIGAIAKLRAVIELLEGVQVGMLLPFGVAANKEQVGLEWMSLPEGLRKNAAQMSAITYWVDYKLRELYEYVLETILLRSNTVKEVLSQRNSTLAIDTATRHVRVKSLHRYNRDYVRDNFGLSFGGEYRKSVEPDDGFKMMSDFSARGIAESDYLNGKVVRARALALKDFGTRNDDSMRNFTWPTRPVDAASLPHQLHYFADWISHIWLHDQDVTRDPLVSDFFGRGYMVDLRRDSEEVRRFEAWRMSRRGDRVGAIELAAKLKAASPANAIGVDFFNDMDLIASRLEGGELLQLFDRFPV